MISMCTLHQLQVASWKQTGYSEAKYHGSKVKNNNNNNSVMYEKTQNELSQALTPTQLL